MVDGKNAVVVADFCYGKCNLKYLFVWQSDEDAAGKSHLCSCKFIRSCATKDSQCTKTRLMKQSWLLHCCIWRRNTTSDC